MGRRPHSSRHDLGLELSGICDRARSLWNRRARSMPFPQSGALQTQRILLKRRRPNGVIVATTAPTHCHYTRIAPKPGARYILCEKPMGVSLAESTNASGLPARQFKTRDQHQMRFMSSTPGKAIVGTEAFGGLAVGAGGAGGAWPGGGL